MTWETFFWSTGAAIGTSRKGYNMPNISYRFFRQLHLYLGCLFAPLLMFFTVSGALQTLHMHSATKDQTYQPPAWVTTLANIHEHQMISKTVGNSGFFRYAVVTMAVALIVTVVLGIVMAFQTSRRPWTVVGCLFCGFVAPLLLLLL